MTQIDPVPVNRLHEKFNTSVPLDYPATSLGKPYTQWSMEIDDAPIFRYIYRTLQPKRHLEFGTWTGLGTLYCLEESAATVWTINLPFGEIDPQGRRAYGNYAYQVEELREWAERLGIDSSQSEYRTDSLGFIGRYYLQKDLGHRVCQIYCDSRAWDISSYPAGFFDTVLIDGGHLEEIVLNDTYKALPLLRSGGTVIWHDFCPNQEALDAFGTCRSVVSTIHHNLDWLKEELIDLFWIEPSLLLVGIKK